jgi:hypothetical protein
MLTSLKEITIDNGFGDKYNVFIDNFYWEIMEEVLSIKDRLINNSNIENIGVKMAEKSIMINVITKKQTDLLKKYLLLLNKKLIKPGVFTNSTYTYIINTGKVSDLIIRTKIDDYSQFDFDNFIKDVVDLNKVTIEKEINDEFVINHIRLK